MVIWIIGLPGSGKTTLAKALHKNFLKKGIASIHLDGDDLRSVWGDDIGYTLKDREKNSLRIQKLCQIFENQGLIVVVSINSIFETHRQKNREIFKDYFEIFLDIHLDILKKRREIYKQNKNVVGIDIEYKKPTTYDLKFDKNFDINLMVKKVFECMNIQKKIGL